MGYQVKKRYQRADGLVVWGIIFEIYTENTRTQRRVPKREWPSIGFQPSMTFLQAKERAAQLSAQNWEEFQERRNANVKERHEREDSKPCPLLPIDLCLKFEKEVLKERICWGEETPHYSQLLIYWRTGKRIIRSTLVEPWDWEEKRTKIYSYFLRRKWSVSYAQKVIRVMNLWGKLYCKTQNNFFEPLAMPTGEASAKLHDAFFEKRPYGMLSAPITWPQLSFARAFMNPRQWNWVFLTLWFGFRPSELKGLRWKIEFYNGQKLLAVYQPKLHRLPSVQRWKFIPILFPEQEIGLQIIQSGQYTEPSIAMIQKYVNENASKRGGRKGFVAHMWEMGKHKSSVSSRWLGHKSTRTTTNHYTQGMQQACEF